MSELPFVILTFRITVCMRAHTHVPMLCCGYRSHDYFLPLCCFCESGTGPELLSANPLTFLLAYISSFYFCVAQKLLLINCKTLLKMWKEFSLIHQDNKCCLHKNFYYIYLSTLSVCVCYSTSLEIRRKHLGVSSLLSPCGARDWTQVSRFGCGPHFYAFHAISIGPI